MTSLRSQVLAVLVPGFDGTTTPDWLKRRLEEGLAGVCWFGQNLSGPEQARDLADELHGLRDDVLVLCDEEGGSVTRLEAEHGSSWPGHTALGRLDDTGATQAVAAALGRQAREAGIDVALSPVVDVNSDPDNPVIGVRSFGSHPDLVARHGAAFVRGVQGSGVAACAKHYPGHGATRTDSHLTLPSVDADASTLWVRDIPPFAAAVQAGVRCVMTAHVVFPALDDQPATMSRRVLAMLREDLGFHGVIVSDALDMHAISGGVGRGPGAVRALASGVDLICIGNPSFPEPYDAEQVLDEVADALEAAVEDGTLSRARLERAADRVAELAGWVRRAGGAEPSGTDRAVGAEVARRALATSDVRLAGHPVVVRVDGPANLAAGAQPSALVNELCRRRPGTAVLDVADPAVLPGLTGRLAGRSVVVVVGGRREPMTASVVASVLAARPDAVVVYTGLPGADPGDRTVRTFDSGRAMAEAAADALLGREDR